MYKDLLRNVKSLIYYLERRQQVVHFLMGKSLRIELQCCMR